MTISADSRPDHLDHEEQEEGTFGLYLTDGVLPLLYSPPEEEGANDNARLVEVVQGTVWRDMESRLGREGDSDSRGISSLPHRSEVPQELDFSETGARRRGFLDEEGD